MTFGKYDRTLSPLEGIIAVGIASHNEEQVRETVDRLECIGVILDEARGYHATLHVAQRILDSLGMKGGFPD